ncbi:MAG: diguanylate cyclase [Phycisphaerae bacterium]|nr:diguanylate cyclase [Phycisphaerae bacterium]
MQPARIILAEDEKEHQELLKQALTAERPLVDVHVVATGGELRKALQRQRFDCAVVDFNLPDTNADELLAAAKKDLHGCPALVVSSNEAQGVAVSSIRSGSVDFVPKIEALEGDRLWKRVEAAIRKTKRNRGERRAIDRRQGQLAQQAETDQLTGLYNRRYLDRQLQSHAYDRDRRRMMSCIMMDIDYFKKVNDIHGHAVGDALLKEIAQMARTGLSGGDAALRWGGDEFLILQPSTDLCEAWVWSKELKSRIGQHVFRAGRTDYTVTVSMGVVNFPTSKMGQEIIDLADQALYLAKRQGRDRVCTWPMVAVDQAMTKIEQGGLPDPARRRIEFLSSCDGILGPTQKQQLWHHCAAVGSVAEQLGRTMGLPEEKLAAIRLGGLLHDLGKSVIPEELLAQQAPLTKEQRAIIQSHSDIGADMSLRLGASGEEAACVRDHHRAFPRAYTKGSFMGLGARLIGVADALEAMTEERPYRSARSHEEALFELTRVSGTQFDPAVVAAACTIKPIDSSAAA